jgi:hypothetical protein
MQGTYLDMQIRQCKRGSVTIYNQVSGMHIDES